MRSKVIHTSLLLMLGWAPMESAEPASSRVQLRFISLSQTIDGAGIAAADGKATPIFISADSLSRPISHPPGRLRLVSTQSAVAPKKKPNEPIKPEDIPPETPGFRKKKLESASPKVKTGNRELGTVDLPTGDHQRFIIIVHPGKGNGLTAIPDRIGFFPPGSDRFVNLTAASLIIDVPSGRQILPANASNVLRPGVAHLRQYKLRILIKEDGEEKLLSSAFDVQNDDRRNLRIVMPGGVGGRSIEIKTISDGLVADDNYR